MNSQGEKMNKKYELIQKGSLITVSVKIEDILSCQEGKIRCRKVFVLGEA